MTSIGSYAFYNCSSLTSIDIYSGVTSIGSDAFNCCSGLKSIDIPSSVTNIGYGEFWNCNSLTSINVEESNSNYKSLDGVLFNKDMSELICYPGGKAEAVYTIPSSVTSIGIYAFNNCSGLTSIEIPSSVMSIGSDAFYNCSSLTSIKIPSSVASIADGAFNGCESLSDVYYAGSEEEWNSISIDYNNDYLLNNNDCLLFATIHYNSIYNSEIRNN